MPADAQSQDRHAESAQRIHTRLTQTEKLVERDLHLRGKVAEVFPHHLPRKSVVARGHGRVGRENIGGGDHLEGGIEIEFFLRHIQPNALEREEGGMAFVHVKNFRLDPEGGERFHAAYAEDNLLPDAHFEIAAVKLGRDETIFRGVLRDIGIEQVKADAPDVQLPDFRPHFAIEEPDGNEQIAVAAAALP